MILALNIFICAFAMVGLNAVIGKFTGLANDWCYIEKCRRRENRHPFCIYPDMYEKYEPFCNTSKLITNENLTRYVIDVYNDFRNRWARGRWPDQKKFNFSMASNMRTVSYDYELDAVARRIAINCPGWDDSGFPILCNRLDRFEDEVTLSHFEFKDYKVKKYKNFTFACIDDFYYIANSINYTDPEFMKKFTKNYSSFRTSFLSRMLWANLRSVAFAETRYKMDWFDKTVQRMARISAGVAVAAYGPRPNNIGESVYEAGFPGENCPIGTVIFYDPRYPYLCGGDTNITEIIYYLPIGGHIDNLPNATDTKKILGNQSNFISNDVLLIIAIALASLLYNLS